MSKLTDDRIIRHWLAVLCHPIEVSALLEGWSGPKQFCVI